MTGENDRPFRPARPLRRRALLTVAAIAAMACGIAVGGTPTQADVDELREANGQLDGSLIDLNAELSRARQDRFDQWKQKVADLRASKDDARKEMGELDAEIDEHTDSGPGDKHLCDVCQDRRAGRFVSAASLENHMKALADAKQRRAAKAREFTKIEDELSALKNGPPPSQDEQRIRQQVDATTSRIQSLSSQIQSTDLRVRAAEKAADDAARAKAKTQKERDSLDEDRARRDRRRQSANDEDRQLDRSVAQSAAAVRNQPDTDMRSNEDTNGGGESNVIVENRRTEGGDPSTNDPVTPPDPESGVIARFLRSNFSLIPSAEAAETETSPPPVLPPLETAPATDVVASSVASGGGLVDGDGMPVSTASSGTPPDVATPPPPDAGSVKAFSSDAQIESAVSSAVGKALGPDAADAATEAFYTGQSQPAAIAAAPPSSPSNNPATGDPANIDGVPVENLGMRAARNQRLGVWLGSSQVAGDDDSAVTTPRPIQPTAAQPVKPSAAGRQAYVAGDFSIKVGKESVGTGQCAAFVQSVAAVGQTKTWRAGSYVKDSEIPSGTPIATFDDGLYPQGKGVNKHAAIYDSRDKEGIWVYDQYVDRKTSVKQNVERRYIKYKGAADKSSYNADRYYVIETETSP